MKCTVEQMSKAYATPSSTDDTFVPLPNEEYEVDVVYPQFHDGNGFCYEPDCDCHEDQDNIQALGQAVDAGECTVDEADNIYHGKTIW